MKITFLGATGTVTGSSYLLEVGNSRVLIDCGMFQGQSDVEERNHLDFLFDPHTIDAVLLTHAHIDHSGLLPKLVSNGFDKKIYTTAATADLCGILLPDSAHIQEEDLEWMNRKRMRAGKELIVALYSKEDVEKTLKLFRPVAYHKPTPITQDITATFYDAGHILGSSFIFLEINDQGQKKTIVFSGDIGNRGQRIVRDPEAIPQADYVFLESTYGNRLHKSRPETVKEFQHIISQSLKSSGNIVIPAFAVERTQEILYELHIMAENGTPFKLPIFVDSPLASSATTIFSKHPECFDEEMNLAVKAGKNPLELSHLKFTQTADESRQINNFKQAMIISASGMCDAGRIRHHLKHNLWRPNAHIVFVGFQADGSLGERIITGAKVVKIFNEEIAVKAHIHTLGGFSAHADQSELMRWIGKIPQPPKQVILVHGEDDSRKALSDKIAAELKFPTTIPQWKQTIEL
ncbi:MAG: MBL fold metallo-hydrolase [bacterium]